LFTNQPPSQHFVDFCIETKEHLILVEMKRLRPNAVEVDNQDFEYLQKYKSLRDWKRDDFPNLNNFLSGLREEDLLKLKAQPTYQSMYSNTVQDLVDSAKKQLRSKYYRATLISSSAKAEGKKIFMFAVVQVSRPFIIEEVLV